MKGVAVVLTLLFGLAVCTNMIEDSSCCFPDRIEGTLRILEEQVDHYIAIDFTNRRLFQQTTFDSDEFKILDLNTQGLYAFNSSGCKPVTTVPLTISHQQCWYVDQPLVEFRALGQDAGMDTFQYTFMDAQYNVTHVNAKKDGICLPFITVAIDTVTKEVSTRLFVDMRAGVSTDKIASSLDC